MPTSLSNQVNLYTLGPVVAAIDDSVDFYLKGIAAGSEDLISSIPFYVFADPFFQQVNLYTLGGEDGSGSLTGQVLLFTGGTGDAFDSSLDLFSIGGSPLPPYDFDTITFEEYYELSLEQLNLLELEGFGFVGNYLDNSIPLYISGEGENEGFYATSGEVLMYVSAGLGLENVIDMYVSGLPSQSIDLYTSGVLGITESSIDMYLASIDNLEGQIRMFIRGYQP